MGSQLERQRCKGGKALGTPASSPDLLRTACRATNGVSPPMVAAALSAPREPPG